MDGTQGRYEVSNRSILLRRSEGVEKASGVWHLVSDIWHPASSFNGSRNMLEVKSHLIAESSYF